MNKDLNRKVKKDKLPKFLLVSLILMVLLYFYSLFINEVIGLPLMVITLTIIGFTLLS